MYFNSIDFALFLPVVFALYWFVAHKNLRIQNALIVGASYFFYACWDWRFLSLIVLSTLVDFSVGLGLKHQTKKGRRKLLLWTSILVNLGMLGFFKYYNFFAENFAEAFSFFGTSINIGTLDIVLPVGISFYTFQTLSYTIDVYRKKLEPTTDFVAFSAFVSFFPQLVAGPIERATNLLPQFYKKRTFDYLKAVDGMKQIVWGLFKKVVIADNCGAIANEVFNNAGNHSGATMVVGALMFTFQIYGDFSGYSDIAIGTSRLFGFDLKRNFAFPYFSRDIAEFWRRWHISLSTWFRDYLYIPLGGSRGGTWMKLRNTVIIFVVSGFWHGPKWTFVIWGALNAIYFIPLLLSKNNRNHLEIVANDKRYPSGREIFGIALTFGLTVFAWIWFRAESVGEALIYIERMFAGLVESTSYAASWTFIAKEVGFILPVFLVFFLIIEWFGRSQEYGFAQTTSTWSPALRWTFYYFLIILIALSMIFQKEQPFIYFQF